MKQRKLIAILLCTMLSTNLYADNSGFKIETGQDGIGLGKEYVEPITAVEVKAIFANANTQKLITPNLPQKSAYLRKLQGLSSTEGQAGAMQMNNEAGLNANENGSNYNNPNGTSTSGNTVQGLQAILDDCAHFYIDNVAMYDDNSTGTAHTVNRNKGKSPYTAYADCSGFATFFMSNVSGKNLSSASSGDFVSGTYSSEWGAAGWKKYKASDFKSASELRSGDVIARNGHVEVIYDTKSTFGWGDTQTKCPTYTGGIKLANGQVVIYEGGYTAVWRYEGSSK